MRCRSFNAFFETIANKTRLNIIELLTKNPLSVTQICNNLKEEQSKISHNLKILSDCNFVTAKQKGKQRIYTLNKDTILPLMQLVEKHVSKYCPKKCPKK